MKLVILNNDLRVYWKGRLVFLRRFLQPKGIEFYAIELFGKGSPYSFDVYNNHEAWWSCLFPGHSHDGLEKKNIESTLFSALDKINPDIIIAPSIVFFAGALGIRWAKKHNKKFIMFDDALPHQVRRSPVVQWVKNIITRQADGFWFPAEEYYKKEYYKPYHYLHKKGQHFFYGFSCTDNAFFKSPGPNTMDHKTIICVARLVPIKNLDTLIKAWADVEKENTGYRLTIVGNGPEYDNLTTLKRSLNITTIDFLGVIDNNNLASYYHKADAFILPSLSESWGLVVNEAMAAGLPVILSHNVNAAKCLLKAGTNGFGFNPDDIEDMKSAILSFINMDIDSKKLMSAASLKIIEGMSYKKMGDQLAEALEVIRKQKLNIPGPLAREIINIWGGRYNTTGWDRAE